MRETVKALMKLKTYLKSLFAGKSITSLSEAFPNVKVSFLDVGARGGIGWPWSVLDKEILEVTLVEPDPMEAQALRDQGQVVVLPYALWSKKTELLLNLNHSPGTSSIFQANMSFLQQFEDSQRFEAAEQIAMEVTTIDILQQEGVIEALDFVKIDVQGGELDILQGGKEFLAKNIVGLEAEVEFSQMYKDQPLFSDIDIFIRNELGLELWDIRKTYWKYKQDQYHTPLKGRLIFGDALYLRSIASLEGWLVDMDAEVAKSKLQALIVTSVTYGLLDYANTIVNSSITVKYLTQEEKERILNYMSDMSKGFYPLRNGNKLLYRIFNVLTHSFKPTHQGWADSEPHLGSRKKLFFWL